MVGHFLTLGVTPFQKNENVFDKSCPQQPADFRVSCRASTPYLWCGFSFHFWCFCVVSLASKTVFQASQVRPVISDLQVVNFTRNMSSRDISVFPEAKENLTCNLIIDPSKRIQWPETWHGQCRGFCASTCWNEPPTHKSSLQASFFFWFPVRIKIRPHPGSSSVSIEKHLGVLQLNKGIFAITSLPSGDKTRHIGKQNFLFIVTTAEFLHQVALKLPWVTASLWVWSWFINGSFRSENVLGATPVMYWGYETNCWLGPSFDWRGAMGVE